MFNFDTLISQCMRKTSKIFVDLLARTDITPNQITLFRLLVSVPLLIYFFSRGEYLFNLLGVLVFSFLLLLDFVDGGLARKTNRTSALGLWLDEVSDIVIMSTIFLSIFYAALTSHSGWRWPLVVVFFFFGIHSLALLQAEFGKRFDLGIHEYSKLRETLYKLEKNPSFIDRFYIGVLDVVGSPFFAFCFCIRYPLLVGIIINKILWAFTFIAVMFNVRFFLLSWLYYRVLRDKDDRSVLVGLLRERFKSNV